MNQIFTIMFIGFLLFSCKKESNQIETDLYRCLITPLSEEEKTKLNLIIKDFENHLIEKGILQSLDSKGYYNFYENIAKSEVYNFTNEFNFSEKISFLNRKSPEEHHGLINCHQEIFQSEKYLKSKLFRLTKEVHSLRKHRITPVILAKTTIKHLSEEDFTYAYNRFNTLMFIERYK